MDAHTGEVDPAALIVRLARGIAESARALGWSGPPYSLAEVASMRGLKIKGERQLPDDQSALLLGTMVFTNGNHAIVRQRYSQGHEIVHTLFPDWRNPPLFSPNGKTDGESEVEFLCQLGAAEIVMPYWCFPAQASEYEFGLRAGWALADLYTASPEAALRRLVDFAPGPAALVTFALGHRKSERVLNSEPILPGFEEIAADTPAKLRIQRSHLSPHLVARRIRFPYNKSLPDSSVCYKALAHRNVGRAGVHRATERWEINGIGDCCIEAVAWLERDGAPAGGMCLLWEKPKRTSGDPKNWEPLA
jgi:Zn-dependent peptidase ImmA (M78 family)